MRSRLTVRPSGHRVHQATTIMANLVSLGIQYQHKAIALLHGDLQALFQTTLVCLGDNHLIDHYLDAVHLITIQLHPMEDLFQLAIDTDVQISFFTYLLEKFLIVPLTITDQRSQEIRFFPLYSSKISRKT